MSLLRTSPSTHSKLSTALLGAAILSACSSAGIAPADTRSALPFVRPLQGSAGQYISHVVVVIQENRSFENFFAGYPGANAPTSGCAIPVGSASLRPASSSGCPPGDISVNLRPVTFSGPTLQHNWRSATVSYHKGRMDGFSRFGNPGLYQPYSYVERSLIEPYWDMAQQYVLADQMFPTEFGGSFTGHLTLIAGTDTIKQSPTRAEVDFPNGLHDDCDSPPGTRSSYVNGHRDVYYYRGPFPCFDQFNTMAQVLDGGGISWKMYADRVVGAGMWEPFEAIKYVRYGSDWGTNIIAPQSQFLSDPAMGQLAAVSWVTPSRPDSDHPGDGDGGPSWVASIVNAIGESPYWNSTAIVVVWDDWGGWYDNSPPPQLDFRGLGIRVPCLIVSPYAKQHYVSHVRYEYGSILHFIEEVYSLGNIGPVSEGYTDARANSLDDAFDFTQKPRPFSPIPAKYPAAHFLHEPPPNGPVDTE
jgi:phospholipase C